MERFKRGDIVVFFNKSGRDYLNKIDDFSVHRISIIRADIHNGDYFYLVDVNGDINSNKIYGAYFESDFMTLKEYRKYKLDIINNV